MAEPGATPRHESVTVTPALLRAWPLPAAGGDKEDKGRLLVVGGSDRTPGAVRLAAEAALRVGAGKVQVATTLATAALLAVVVPEAFVVGLPTEGGELAVAGAGELLDLAEGADAVLVGPGLGAPEVGCRLLEAVAPRLATRLVIDALGTGFVTRHPRGLAHLGPDALLTANTTELAELLGRDVEQVEEDVHGAAIAVARMAGVAVLAGAAVSYVTQPSGEAWALPMGVPGAAVAGSGDVKAGAVAGLLARGAEPAQAAVWGAYLHARAGERLAASVGRVGYLAREIARELPAAVGEVEV
ncbi:MAG TPA: NAD(P)H-hydrate dehydratase [Ornithinibacter sp.]|nr:NAD(P)H-hydrate dehydratase [Ornithinibacter sp.]